jgi:hypothetical protein
VVDVGLLTAEQAALLKNNVTASFAPLLCVEVLSPSNTLAEMNHKGSSKNTSFILLNFFVVIYFNIENSTFYVIISASIQLMLPEMRR